jgi:hypothetical protein
MNGQGLFRGMKDIDHVNDRENAYEIELKNRYMHAEYHLPNHKEGKD